jgi:hypothetical protein
VNIPSAIACPALAALTPFVVGCTGQIPLGLEAPYWMADHETGDFSQWSKDEHGNSYLLGDATLSIVSSPVHSGRYAAKSSVNAAGRLATARLYRQDTLPPEAYYSVWLYVPAEYSVGDYWSVFEFSGRTDPNDSGTFTTAWTLNLHPSPDTGLSWYVWDGIRGQDLMPANPVGVPVGRWFQLEAFVRQATDDTGQVSFWVDGSLFVDQSGVSTVPTLWMSWSVGSVEPSGTQEPADLYIDDAVISSMRWGG